MPNYIYKRAEELAWAAVTGAGLFLLQVALRFDPDTITDWRTWGIIVGGGIIRAAAGAVLAKLSSK